MAKPYKIGIGSQLKLGDGPTYEIVSFYFAIGDLGNYCDFIELKNLDSGEIEINLIQDVYWLLQNGSIWPVTANEWGQQYYETIVKPRREKMNQTP